jgi:hypothetical protein
MMLPVSFFVEVRMRKRCVMLVAIALGGAILAGCAPQLSLFPVYMDGDLYFDEALNGTWRVEDAADKKSDDALRLTFQGDKEARSYLVIGRSKEKPSSRLLMEARLAHIGKYEFMDFSAPTETESEAAQPHDQFFPTIAAHIFARVDRETGGLKLSFLDDKWVDDEMKAKTLKLRYIDIPEGLVLSAPTAELRQFVLEHAEDEKTFSAVEHLKREK